MEKQVKVIQKNTGGGGAVYGLGLIGALIYFIQNASSFLDGILGILKAIVWPAFLTYSAFLIFSNFDLHAPG